MITTVGVDAGFYIYMHIITYLNHLEPEVGHVVDDMAVLDHGCRELCNAMLCCRMDV